jgi:hypothetical protein
MVVVEFFLGYVGYWEMGIRVEINAEEQQRT